MLCRIAAFAVAAAVMVVLGSAAHSYFVQTAWSMAAGAVTRFTGHRTIVFAICAAASIFVMFSALRMLMGTVAIFGARSTGGLAMQMVVGLTAAVVYARLTMPPARR